MLKIKVIPTGVSPVLNLSDIFWTTQVNRAAFTVLCRGFRFRNADFVPSANKKNVKRLWNEKKVLPLYSLTINNV